MSVALTHRAGMMIPFLLTLNGGFGTNRVPITREEARQMFDELSREFGEKLPLPCPAHAAAADRTPPFTAARSEPISDLTETKGKFLIIPEAALKGGAAYTTRDLATSIARQKAAMEETPCLVVRVCGGIASMTKTITVKENVEF